MPELTAVSGRFLASRLFYRPVTPMGSDATTFAPVGGEIDVRVGDWGLQTVAIPPGFPVTLDGDPIGWPDILAMSEYLGPLVTAEYADGVLAAVRLDTPGGPPVPVVDPDEEVAG